MSSKERLGSLKRRKSRSPESKTKYRHSDDRSKKRSSDSHRRPDKRNDEMSSSNIPEGLSSANNPEGLDEKEEGPNFALSGKLLEDTNVYNGVVIKYSEPEEARKPKRRWRFYVFKGEESLPILHLHRQSAYLIGKDRKVADIPVDHPSCSRQHAVIQYRAVTNKVRPYIIDLGSSNGTFLNNQKIDPQRYVEMREKDVLKFGFSSREYVLLHEHSQDEFS